MIEVIRGDTPLVLGLPHTGTEIPQDCLDRLNATGRTMADTDWHIHQLYDGLVEGLTTVRTPIHRYVIDVNRAPSDESLYPGQNTTGLCPLTDFDGQPIYQDGQHPDVTEIARRGAAYHAPYHDVLATEMDRIRAKHGFAVLFDCHSIRGELPFLFNGQLPDFNIGTNSGATCDPSIAKAVAHICESAAGYSTVQNGRFKGGWTTRHYGQPGRGLHAIQMELAQSTYMLEAPPWTYLDDRAAQTRAHLKSILETLSRWSPA